ncbi:MAG: hypothetical protein M3Z75_27925 [Actinomycetota bacterium]|nr:hypothetical protein [Actinomycetota bacterium]
MLVVAVACGLHGEVGGPERGVPQALEVVLGAAQVQGESVVEEAEPGECFLQPVDGAGGGPGRAAPPARRAARPAFTPAGG